MTQLSLPTIHRIHTRPARGQRAPETPDPLTSLSTNHNAWKSTIKESVFGVSFLLTSSSEFHIIVGKTGPHLFICPYTLIGLPIFCNIYWGAEEDLYTRQCPSFIVSWVISELKFQNWKAHLATSHSVPNCTNNFKVQVIMRHRQSRKRPANLMGLYGVFPALVGMFWLF